MLRQRHQGYHSISFFHEKHTNKNSICLLVLRQPYVWSTGTFNLCSFLCPCQFTKAWQHYFVVYYLRTSKFTSNTRIHKQQWKEQNITNADLMGKKSIITQKNKNTVQQQNKNNKQSISMMCRNEQHMKM